MKNNGNNFYYFCFVLFIDESQKLFKTYEKFFEDDDKFSLVDENKRIDKSRFNSSNYGLEGSFKKIEFD